MRFLFILFFSVCLSACGSQPYWLMQKRYFPEWNYTPRAVNNYDFNWQMRGDSEALPVQVFSTDGEIWLQYDSLLQEQTQKFLELPTLIAFDPNTAKEKVLKIYKNPPYLVINGQYSEIKIRFKSKEAMVWRVLR